VWISADPFRGGFRVLECRATILRRVPAWC